MATQIRQENGITILEPSGKLVGTRSIRPTESDFTADRGC